MLTLFPFSVSDPAGVTVVGLCEYNTSNMTMANENMSDRLSAVDPPSTSGAEYISV